MKKNSSSENSLVEKNYVKRTATDSDHHTETDLEKYMNELKGIIKAYEEQKHTTNQFTAFKVSQKDISIQETLEMYQSLFEISGNDEKVTVLTIRNNHLAETDSSEKCIKNIITAAQNLMYEKRNETFLDDLYVQTEVIDRNYIQDYDALNKNLRLIEQSKNNFTAYIIDNIFEVIYGSLTQYLFNEIDLALYFNLHLGCRCTDMGYNKGKIEFKTTKEDFVKDAYAKILSRVEKFLWFNSVVSTIYEEPPHVQYSVFSLIKSYIVDYEKKNNFNGFSNIDDEAINDIITDTINNYEYIFNKNIKEITPIFLQSLQNTDSKGMIDEILEYIHEAMVEYCKLNAETEDESLLDHVRKIGRQLETDEKLTSKYQKYCQKIALDPIQFGKLSDTYRAKFDGYVKSLQADNIARIIIGGELNETKLCRLCNVMTSTNVLNHLSGHQSIYIDLDREMSQDKLEASFAKFKARSKEAINLVSKSDPHFTAIQVYTTAKLAQKEVAKNAILFLTYETDTKAVKEQEACTISTIRYDVANTTQVKVETYNDQKSCFERLSCISSDCDVSSINNLNIITITNDLETMIVYIVQNTTDGLSRENIPLFYHIAKAKKELHAQSEPSGSSIKSVRNAPVTYLKDLVNYIQQIQLTSGKDSVIPNLISLDNIELLYTERTYDQPAKNIYRYIGNYFDRLSKAGIEVVAEMYMAKDEIMQSQGFGYFYLTKLMDKLSSEFGIENEEFCKVLYTSMIGRYIRDGSEYWKHQLYLCKSIKNNFILVEPQADGTNALKIFEDNDGADFLSAEIQSAKIFRSILADENNQKLLNFFVYVAKRLNHGNTFIATVINDVYKTKNFNNLHENFINRPDEIRKYVEIYLQYIGDLSRTDNLNSLGITNNSAKMPSHGSNNHLMITVEEYPDQAEVEKLVAKTFDEIYYNMSVCEIKMMTIMLTKNAKDQNSKCHAEIKKCCENKHLSLDKGTDKKD